MSTLHYEIVPGNSTKVTVFLHGLMGRGRNFTQLAKALSAHTTSVLVDQPNHGESDWTDSFSYPDMASRVARLLLNLPEVQNAGGKVHLIGHSMGGKTAMLLALTHPELVATLTVVDIAPASSEQTGYFQKLLAALQELTAEQLRERSLASQALAAKIPDSRVRAFLLTNLIGNKHSGYRWQPNLSLFTASMPEIMGFPDVSDAVFHGPVLWIAGGRSNYIQPMHFAHMERLFPDMLPVTVADAGHWVHADKPKEFLTLVQEFISSET